MSASRLALFGGYTGTNSYSDTWEWRGTEWVDVTPPGPRPTVRGHHTMVYDPDRAVLQVFGGRTTQNAGTPLADTWEQDRSPLRTPGVLLDVGVEGAGIETTALDGATVRGYCAGSFTPYGASDVGAALVAWANGGPLTPAGAWRTLAVNATALEGQGAYSMAGPPVGLVSWTTSDPATARQLLTTRAARVTAGCFAGGPSGTGDAAVALNYLEVRLRYTAP